MQGVQVPQAMACGRDPESHSLAIMLGQPEAVGVMAERVRAKREGAGAAGHGIVEQVTVATCAKVIGGSQEELIGGSEVVDTRSPAVRQAKGVMRMGSTAARMLTWSRTSCGTDNLTGRTWPTY
jgi:hypothetical protein